MHPIRTLIRDAKENVDRSAFGGEEVHKGYLCNRDPGSSESKIVEEVLGQNWRIDGGKKKGRGGDVRYQDD
jgi:hypothetical protein